nr:lysophospholipid acyltransferase family protein [uncultured Peptostreptococcus sp.]
MRFYNFICSILRFILNIFYKIEIIGQENIPNEGKYILIANHKHYFDPLFMIGSIKNRRIIPVAKQELFNIPVLKSILNKLEVIPINRSNPSISTVKSILSQLKNGRILGIFPEGTRCKDLNGFLPAKPGVALFSIKSKSDIIPMSIITNYRLFSKVRIIIGHPIDMSPYYNTRVDKTEYQNISQYVFDEVIKNFDEHKKGIELI